MVAPSKPQRDPVRLARRTRTEQGPSARRAAVRRSIEEQGNRSSAAAPCAAAVAYWTTRENPAARRPGRRPTNPSHPSVGGTAPRGPRGPSLSLPRTEPQAGTRRVPRGALKGGPAGGRKAGRVRRTTRRRPAASGPTERGGHSRLRNPLRAVCQLLQPQPRVVRCASASEPGSASRRAPPPRLGRGCTSYSSYRPASDTGPRAGDAPAREKKGL